MATRKNGKQFADEVPDFDNEDEDFARKLLQTAETRILRKLLQTADEAFQMKFQILRLKIQILKHSQAFQMKIILSLKMKFPILRMKFQILKPLKTWRLEKTENNLQMKFQILRMKILRDICVIPYCLFV